MIEKTLSRTEPARTERDRHILDLHRAMHYWGDLYSIHYRLCRARKEGLDCAKCQQLEQRANAAEDAYLAGRTAADGGA